MSYPFNESQVLRALQNQDWSIHARKLFAECELDSPSGLFLRSDLNVLVAETMCEIDGLLLATATIVDIQSEDIDDSYWCAGFVLDLSEDLRATMLTAISAEATKAHSRYFGSLST